MPANNAWSSKLKELREKTNTGQTLFQGALGQHLLNISQTEKDGLKEIGIYDDLVKFANADPSLMGRYEGALYDPPRDRKRYLSIIWGLQKIGALGQNKLTPLQEADELLNFVRFDGLNPREREVILGQDHVAVDKGNSKDSASSNQPLDNKEEKATQGKTDGGNQEPPRKPPFLLIAVGALVAVAVIAGYLLWTTDDTSPAWFYEDFSGSSINTEEWKYSEDSLLYVNDGKLVFDFLFDPSKTATVGDWQEQTLEHKRVDESFNFSRIKFSAALTTPSENASGSFGVQTHCNGEKQSGDNKGNLLVYLGGQGHRLTATYSYDNYASGISKDIMPIETGKLYVIDLAWNNAGVDIFVNGQKKTSEPIPCPPPLYFNINGGVASDTAALKGFIEEIQVWDFNNN